jgi:hypothetical protein
VINENKLLFSLSKTKLEQRQPHHEKKEGKIISGLRMSACKKIRSETHCA